MEIERVHGPAHTHIPTGEKKRFIDNVPTTNSVYSLRQYIANKAVCEQRRCKKWDGEPQSKVFFATNVLHYISLCNRNGIQSISNCISNWESITKTKKLNIGNYIYAMACTLKRLKMQLHHIFLLCSILSDLHRSHLMVLHKNWWWRSPIEINCSIFL